MSAETLRNLFAGLLLFETGYEIFLTWLNLKHVRKHAGEVPQAFQLWVDLPTYQKTVLYTVDKNRFSIITHLLSSAFVLFLVYRGALGWLDVWVLSLAQHVYLQGLLYLFLLSAIFSVFSLPAALYRQFVLEQRYGFNRMTLRLFFIDLAKGLLVQMVLMGPLLLLLFWFMDTAGKYWWIWGFGFVTLFQLLLSVLYPVLIAPLFNQFTPLTEGTLKHNILRLAETLGFKTAGIFVMDGSKRSQHSNAYFTGLGKAKRVVLYDTLIQTLKEEETCAVLAHEIGHEKKKHIWKLFALSTGSLFLAFVILEALLQYKPLYEAFGFSRTSYHGIIAILSLCAGPCTFLLNPLVNGWSRRFEYEADRFTAERASLGQALASALLTLGRTNLVNLTPHPWYSFHYYSHPTLLERLEALNRVSKTLPKDKVSP
ncbi:MAG: M48 family metallopeptidase [Spirochaetales bacterium]